MTEKIKIRKCYSHPYKPDPPADSWLSYQTKKGTTIYHCKWCHEMILIKLAKWKEENKKNRIESEKRAAENLSDWYVRDQLLKGIKSRGKAYDLITAEMVDFLRATIKLQRLIKKKKAPPTPIMQCKKHGPIFVGDLIKSGKSRWTGNQRYKCRQCMSDQHRDYYERKKEYVLKKTSDYRKNNPEKIKEIRRNYNNKLKEINE